MSMLEECCDILEREFKELSSLGRCEAILFFSTHVMDYGELKNEIDMDEFVDRFKFLLMDKIAFQFNTNNMFRFLNARVAFYKEEYQRMKENSLHIPLALYNLFYLNPGCDNPEDIAGVDASPQSITSTPKLIPICSSISAILLPFFPMIFGMNSSGM